MPPLRLVQPVAAPEIESAIERFAPLEQGTEWRPTGAAVTL